MGERAYWALLLQLLDHAAESATPAVAAAESEVDLDDSEAIAEGIHHRSMPLTVRIAAAMRRLLRRSWLDTNVCRKIQIQQKLSREVLDLRDTLNFYFFRLFIGFLEKDCLLKTCINIWKQKSSI